jgi:hypothetical protein
VRGLLINVEVFPFGRDSIEGLELLPERVRCDQGEQLGFLPLASLPATRSAAIWML